MLLVVLLVVLPGRACHSSDVATRVPSLGIASVSCLVIGRVSPDLTPMTCHLFCISVFPPSLPVEPPKFSPFLISHPFYLVLVKTLTF